MGDAHSIRMISDRQDREKNISDMIDQLIFLDTETTGTGPDDRLCQVAYSYAGGEHEALFKPPVPITIDAMSVTHITNRIVEECETFADSGMRKELADILVSGAVLVAHNAKFDIDMLRREGLEVKHSIDTFKLSHHLDKDGSIPRHNLQYLRYYHDLEVPDAQAHDALGDVRVLRALFSFYLSRMMGEFPDEESVVEEMLRVSSKPILLKKFNFGKYAGMAVEKVAMEDRDYISWLFNQKVMTREQGGEDDENWIYTLDHYLPKS